MPAHDDGMAIPPGMHPEVMTPTSESSERRKEDPSAVRGRLFIFARHAESTANSAGVVSSSPSIPLSLTARGQAQARTLGEQLANFEIELAIGTRLLRTQQTIELAMHGREVPTLIDADFDEIHAGEMDGKPMETYWSWKEHHSCSTPFPGGESVNDAIRRYARAIRHLLERKERAILVIAHELGLRSIAMAVAGGSSAPTSVGAWEHAVPYLFDAEALSRAVVDLDMLAPTEESAQQHENAG